MQNWTAEIWQAAGVGLIIGLILGYVIIRFTKGSVKKQAETEQKLKQAKIQLETYKTQLEKHFTENANLLKTLAQDYQKLYNHLITGATALLPELANKAFTNTLPSSPTTENTVDSAQNLEPVRDYSEGSSGILKAEK